MAVEFVKGHPVKVPDFCRNGYLDFFRAHVLDNICYSALKFLSQQFEFEDFQRSRISVPLSIRNALAKRQAEYLAGRLCARNALTQLDRDKGFMEPTITEDGTPKWPAGIIGSISHSRDGLAAAVVAYTKYYLGLGIDIETLFNDSHQRLVKKILTVQEQEVWRCCGTVQRKFFLTLVFSLKESLFKAIYPKVKRYFYFQDAMLLNFEQGGNQGKAKLVLLNSLSDEFNKGCEFSAQYCLYGQSVITLVMIEYPFKPLTENSLLS